MILKSNSKISSSRFTGNVWSSGGFRNNFISRRWHSETAKSSQKRVSGSTFRIGTESVSIEAVFRIRIHWFRIHHFRLNTNPRFWWLKIKKITEKKDLFRDSESGSTELIESGNRRARIVRSQKISFFAKAVCSLLGAEGFSCSLQSCKEAKG